MSDFHAADHTAMEQRDDPALIERIRRKVMREIAADSVGNHVVVATNGGQWQSFLPGIERKVLHESGDALCYLLKFAPGAILPAHRHPVDEECVVLEGTLRVGALVLPAGSFHLVRRNMLDPDSTSDDGAVIYLRGAPPRAEQLL